MFTQSYGVIVTPTLVRKDGTVVDLPPQHNMITDFGIATLMEGGLYSAPAMLTNIFVGTDATPNFRSTGIGVLSCTISTLTASEPTFLAADATNKRTIQLDDNTIAYITAFTNDAEVTINIEANFTGKSARIWNTEIIKLYGYAKTGATISGASYGNEFGTNTTTIYKGVDSSLLRVTTWNTKRFDYVDVGGVVREIGWSFTTSTTSNLCGRLVLDTPITVQEAEMLFIKIEIQQHVPIGPITADPIFGLPCNIMIPMSREGTSRHPFGYGFAPNGSSLNANTAPVLSIPNTILRFMVAHSGGTVLRERSVSKQFKPYKVICESASIINTSLTSISMYGFNHGCVTTDKEAYAYRFVIDPTVRPNLTTTQLLRITPVIYVNRYFPPFPGTTDTTYDEIAREKSEYDGSAPCISYDITANLGKLGFSNTYCKYTHYDPLTDRWYVSDGGTGSDGCEIRWCANTEPYSQMDYINVGAYTELTSIAVDADYIYVVKSVGTPVYVYNKTTKAKLGEITNNNSGTYLWNMGGVVYLLRNDGVYTVSGLTLTPAGFTLPYIAIRFGYEFADYFVMFTDTTAYGIRKSDSTTVWTVPLPYAISGGYFDNVNKKIILISPPINLYVESMDIINWND